MKNIKTRLVVIIVSIVILATLCVGATTAFLKNEANVTTNTFDEVDPPEPTINEEFNDGETVKKNVTITLSKEDKEYGSYFVRAAILFSFRDASGNTVAKTPVAGTDYTIEMGSDWVKSGNYWYYKSEVQPGGTTTNLITKCTTLNKTYKLVVDIVAQDIQSYPTSVAQTEWGYVPSAD